MNENDYTAYHYSNGVEKRTKEDLLDEYREILFADEMRIQREKFLAGKRFLDKPAVRKMLFEIEEGDPIWFGYEFDAWVKEQGWCPHAGSIAESGAGTRAAGEVHS